MTGISAQPDVFDAVAEHCILTDPDLRSFIDFDTPADISVFDGNKYTVTGFQLLYELQGEVLLELAILNRGMGLMTAKHQRSRFFHDSGIFNGLTGFSEVLCRNSEAWTGNV